METKDTDLQVLKQYQGFLTTRLMIDQLPGSKITAFEFEALSETRVIEDFPYDEARVFNFLGKRAEIFFKYYLQLSNPYKQIAYSLQVIDEKTTLGEFDFICEDKVLEETLHVELVNKIYLYDDNLHENPDYCWIGPNRRDRFIDKLEKLKTQQFPLLYHPLAESSLKELNIDPWKVKQKLCFKAILFLPEYCNTRFFTTNLEAVAGYFYTLEEFLNKKWKNNTFFIPKKINWFTDESQHTKWNSYSKTLFQLQEFMEQKQSVMLFRRNKKGETRKCFVVWW
ncbi:DUF1853 family protein [Psychroflexus montanilacus]|uniref:DUF1853 family protein n=1 Tax=Psychroflexus montanilacus TaxID=2873598 RepID=UPI001CCF96B6|nr:DUF1853 family protein [Psychroflexus montanilacus]MBZ9650455.1 DUF1853 family protein [Psychroflexus montanilacus]